MIDEQTFVPNKSIDPDNTDTIGGSRDSQQKELNEIQLKTLSEGLRLEDASADYAASFSSGYPIRREEFLSMFSELNDELSDVFEGGVRLEEVPFKLSFGKQPIKGVNSIKIPAGEGKQLSDKGFINVSRSHAGLTARVGSEGRPEVRVFDLGSTNHTWVNGELVEDIDKSMEERSLEIAKTNTSEKKKAGIFSRIKNLVSNGSETAPLKLENIWNQALMEGKNLNDGDVVSLGRINQGNGSVHLYVDLRAEEGMAPVLNLIPIPARAAGIIANINKSLSRSFDQTVFDRVKEQVNAFHKDISV
jgi:pSer/pThr/pTyr-binding forkhead associated (FHA) protein